jgi:DNA-binding MarR family transcriptional regulator
MCVCSCGPSPIRIMAATRTKKKKRKATLGAPRSVAKPADKRADPEALFDSFLPYLIARLAWLLNLDLIEKLRREGINLARWRILAVLAMGDGITISEIIERAMMQQSALSRVLMTMEEEEYVRRVPRQDDARYVDVFLTDRGRELFKSLDTMVRRRQNRLLRDFTPQEADAAFALMRRLIHNLTD